MISGLIAPLVTAVILIPYRDSAPRLHTVLIILAVVVAVAASGVRIAGLLATASAIIWFDYFLALEYNSLDWFSAKHMGAVLLVIGIGCAVSEIAARLRRQREGRELANRRLKALYEATASMGASLDVEQTAKELVQALVPEVADFVTVDLSTDSPSPQSANGVHSVPTTMEVQGDKLTTIPLLAGAERIGAVTCWRSKAAGTAIDLNFAEELANKASSAIDNARRYSKERLAALTLQRSLLPRSLPENPAVKTASRYLPAHAQAGVGGDWFDVISLAGARVALVVGDVVGHGIQASATMGKLRAAVRTLAEVDLPPAELLTHLDDLVLHSTSDLSPDSADGDMPPPGEVGATCLYAIYDPITQECTLATAGHPLPVMVDADRTVTLVSGHIGPPLGLGGLPFENIELQLAEGTVIALYTDGLVQSRERDADQGLAEMSRALAMPSVSLEMSCDAVVSAVLDRPPRDDAALLLAQTLALSPDQVATWDIPADPALVAQARQQAMEQLADWGLEESGFITELVVSELVTNAIRYGAAPIQLRIIRNGGLICEVSDASSTSPHLRRSRSSDEGGRGLLLVAQLTRSWGTRHTSSGKVIWCEQDISAQESSES